MWDMLPSRRASSTPVELDLDAAIVEIVSSGNVRVPPYPAVAMRVEELVRKEDYGLDQLTRLVASDQALAADALRCANSAFYSRGTPVTTLNAAITRIGAMEVARLALASGLGANARAPGPLASLKRSVWLGALASAAITQELAKKRKLPSEEAFVCGLLHDFGKMIAIACVEEIIAKAGGPVKPRPLEAWVEVVERYHVELGLVLAAKWDLPQMVSDVISLHHQEDRSGAVDVRMVELVAATDEVVAMLTEQSSVTMEDLGNVSSLTGPECTVVARALDALPAFIASFEGGGAGPSSAVQNVIEPESPEDFATGPTPVDFPVTIIVNRVPVQYQAMGIAPNNLMVKGARPLPENALMELKLGCKPPLNCWATAKLSWPEEGGHTVLLQPFALNGPTQAAWKEMVRLTTETTS